MTASADQGQASFLVTRVHDDGEYSRHLDYLLANGARRRVTIDVAHDNPALRNSIGDALHKRFVEGAK